MKLIKGKDGQYVDLYPDSGYDPTQWERACITVDTCICRIFDSQLQVLLSKRDSEPFSGKWGMPGGFVDIAGGESLKQASYRILKEKTGVADIPVRQLATYGDPGRDPRWRIITVVYYALVCDETIDPNVLRTIRKRAGELEHCWKPLGSPGAMAFDHSRILLDLLKRLREDIKQKDIAFELVPPEFTWSQLKRVYESILGHPLAAGNFRRDMLRIYNIEKLDKLENGRGRGKGRTGVILRYIGPRMSLKSSA